MAGTGRFPWTVVARRVAARTVRYVLRDPVVILALGVLAIALVLGGPSMTSAETPMAAASTEDAAERYMRGLRDRDVARVFTSLSPEMRRSLERRTGLLGPAAVAALFYEHEQRGERIAAYQLVASYGAVQGEELRFYVAHVERGGERRDIPYAITLAPDGTIINVE